MEKNMEQLSNEESSSKVSIKEVDEIVEIVELSSAEECKVVVKLTPEESGLSQMGQNPEKKTDVATPQKVAQILREIQTQSDHVTQSKSAIEKEETLIHLQKKFQALTNVEWKPGATAENLDITEVPVAEESEETATTSALKKKKKKKKKKKNLDTESENRDTSNQMTYESLKGELLEKGANRMKAYSFHVTSQVRTFKLNGITTKTTYPIYLFDIIDGVNESGLFKWYSDCGIIYELSFYTDHQTLRPNKVAMIAFCNEEERDTAFRFTPNAMSVSKHPPSNFPLENEKLPCLNENSFCSCVPALYSELEIILDNIAKMKNRVTEDMSRVYQSYIKMHAAHSFVLERRSGTANTENIINASNFIDSISFSEFNEKVLFRMFEILTGAAGIQYRTEENWISTIYYQYVETTSPAKLNAEMRLMIENIKALDCDDSWVNRVIMATAIKSEMLKVHPFPDYNGRLCRILYCWALRKINPDIPFIIFPENEKMEYNMSLYSAQDCGDPYLWHFYAQKCIKRTLLQLESYLKCKCSNSK